MKITISFLLTFFSILSFSQDLIITNSGDSLNCRTTKVDNEYIYFIYKQKNETISTMISKNSIRVYTPNYYSKTEVSSDYVPNMSENYLHHRFGLNLGYSYRIAKYGGVKEAESYFDGLRGGILLFADYHYFFTKSIGFGAKVNWSNYKNSISKYGNYGSDDISLTYIAPSFAGIIKNSKNNINFFYGFSIGYLGYKDNEEINGDKLTITSSTLGLSLDIGVDFKLNNNIMLGFQLSLLRGTISEYYSEGKKVDLGENKESLSRIEVTIGLRFLGK